MKNGRTGYHGAFVTLLVIMVIIMVLLLHNDFNAIPNDFNATVMVIMVMVITLTLLVHVCRQLGDAIRGRDFGDN